MCGIAGLHLRNAALQPQLGSLLQTMLCQAAERGTDAAGVGIYGDASLNPAGRATVCVIESPLAAAEATAAVQAALGQPVDGRGSGQTTVFTAAAAPEALEAAVRAALPGAVLTSRGTNLSVLKGTGHPDDLATTFRLAEASGYQGVAHTRMATESAVTSTGSHPYSVGPDQCMVHNGSFANHATIRRELEAEGIAFDSQNDTEVGARFVAKQLAEGADVEKALRLLCERFDGFYTLLVATENSFAVVRDAIACKPAVIAETDEWVAMASEYRYLTGLPGVENARIFEPEPEVVYAWER
ncbi:class II glutamine amidotransferase domain-containing protein [Kineococcus sp. SYSU DK003]|uniref:glutamine amidotransferase n=1 Tax=Kineococcus sp. SYSU DK003 TaxID=3383124 RepID=UPI003D7E6E6D